MRSCHWVEGNDGNARKELENRIRETTETVKKLTKKKDPAKPEVYRSLWAIEKSYEVYCVKRDRIYGDGSEQSGIFQSVI